MDIAELKKKSVAELHAMAEELNITNYSGLRKQDLIFRIEQNLLDSDTVLRGEGVLEILPEGYGFLRSQDWNYLYGPDDIYVSPSQIKRFDLRTGDTILGQVRPPKEGERYLALLKVETVNGDEPEKAKHRIAFDNLRPRYPDERLRLERKDSDLSMRVIDMLAPIGKGQRALISSPPKAGKTILLQKLANSITENHPEVLADRAAHRRAARGSDGHGGEREGRGHLLDLRRAGRPARAGGGHGASRRRKRLVEHGKDVVILLDSITRLARAHNVVVPHSGKILSGGVDANALHKPKRFFGAARNIEGGGSLTIVGTALIETGSRMDEVIFEEFKGTGNMELVLDRQHRRAADLARHRRAEERHPQGGAAAAAGRAEPDVPAAEVPGRHAAGRGDRVPDRADEADQEQQGILRDDGAGVRPCSPRGPGRRRGRGGCWPWTGAASASASRSRTRPGSSPSPSSP